jgi:hypothetical protein
MKKNLILPVLFLFLSTGSFSQVKDSVNKKIYNSDIPKSYHGKHVRFKDSLMMMVLNERYDEIVNEICESNGFVSVLVRKGKNVERFTTSESIKSSLREFRKNLLSDTEIKPSVINEEVYYGEFTRHEIWYFKDFKGDPQKMVVQFVEGTITNILFSL